MSDALSSYKPGTCCGSACCHYEGHRWGAVLGDPGPLPRKERAPGI